MAKRAGLQHLGLRSMTLAFRVADLPAIERSILAALGSHADRDGQAFPGVELLSAETSLGVRTVWKAIGALEKRGIVIRTRRGKTLVNIYAIAVDFLESLPRVTSTRCLSRHKKRKAQ